jgi:hypothetical protein
MASKNAEAASTVWIDQDEECYHYLCEDILRLLKQIFSDVNETDFEVSVGASIPLEKT